MSISHLAAILALGAFVVLDGQSIDSGLQGQLERLFPNASFSPKGGDPPHFKVFGRAQSLIGFACVRHAIVITRSTSS